MRNPLSFLRPVTPIKPVRMEQQAPIIRFGGSPQQQQEEKPWPVWVFILYIVFLVILWLVAYPVIKAITTTLIDPLTLPGYLDLFFKGLPYILFLGLTWIGFRKTFKREGQ